MCHVNQYVNKTLHVNVVKCEKSDSEYINLYYHATGVRCHDSIM